MDNLFTLADARRHDACKSGYNRFKETLRKAYPDTDIETVRWSIGDVARVNLDDALWCFCMVNDDRTRVAAVMPAVRRASAHTTDERVVFCIGEIDRWLAGDDSVDLGAEGDAARAAAWAAAWAADAARAAAWAAVRDAADAARAAAWAAVRDAAWAARAAAGAAWAAAGAAERDNQRADLIAMFPPTFEGAAS
jgi:hypothetical protein